MKNLKFIFEKQIWHYLLLAILLAVVLVVVSLAEHFLQGKFLGVATPVWFYLAIGSPVFHQLYVWFCWRLELYGGLLTQWFGKRAFKIYSIGFAVLILLRPVLITLLSLSNKNTIPSHPMITALLLTILAIPSFYLMYSIKKYFGFWRAFGIDHFDASYRNKPLIKEGIFRFTDNGMYYFGLLILWIPGVLFSSITAIIAALFSHLYIWVHFFCTEKPDMESIYGSKDMA